MQPSIESPSAATSVVAGSRIFYGWYVATAAVMIYFMTNGATIAIPPVFYPKFIEEFKATEAAVSLCSAITLLMSGVVGPFGGALVDRYGVRRLMRIGILILAASVSLYPFVTAVWQLYILHGLFAVGLILCGLLVSVVLLSNWFVARRGTMIGLLVAGSSLAGATLPNLVAPIIAHPDYGWRWGYGVVAALVWVMAVPLTFLVIKEHPREVGQYADGKLPTEIAETPGAARAAPALPGITLRQAVRTGMMWFLAVGSAGIYFAILAVLSQFVIYLKRDLGLSQQLASFYFSVIFMFSLGGKFGFGYLSDRFTKRRVMITTTALLFVANLLLLKFDAGGARLPFSPASGERQLAAFAVLFGLGYGGGFTMIKVLAAECFGSKELGRILGVLTMFTTLGAFTGTTLSGYLRTTTGSYMTAFLTLIGVSLLSLMAVSLVRPAPYDQYKAS